MRNSEWRRRALVSNWACMRFESAIKTGIAAEVAAEGELIELGSPVTRVKR